MRAPFGGDGPIFRDRCAAGRELAKWFVRRRPRGDLLVLGLPRGGVPVAGDVARALEVPLDVFVVRKLGAPAHPEYAIGAIAPGIVFRNAAAIAALGLDASQLAQVLAVEQRELARRTGVYRAGRAPLELAGKTVILVDDGIATGSTMRAAVEAVRALGAVEVIAAAPTASRQAERELEQVADLVVVLATPDPYMAVGRWYASFPQLRDCEVVALLDTTAARTG
jgi:putative phosphoribosyl transferase